LEPHEFVSKRHCNVCRSRYWKKYRAARPEKHAPFDKTENVNRIDWLREIGAHFPLKFVDYNISVGFEKLLVATKECFECGAPVSEQFKDVGLVPIGTRRVVLKLPFVNTNWGGINKTIVVPEGGLPPCYHREFVWDGKKPNSHNEHAAKRLAYEYKLSCGYKRELTMRREFNEIYQRVALCPECYKNPETFQRFEGAMKLVGISFVQRFDEEGYPI